ncbi:MAG: hypothetical protein ACJ79W_00580 [Myxococcales bacterium]
MIREDAPPTEEELREAELVARALEEPPSPVRDVASVADALSAASLLRGSRQMELTGPRARAVEELAWLTRSRIIGRKWKLGTLLARSVAVAAAAAAVAFFALRPHRTAVLPAPGVRLLRAQFAAARPGSGPALARLEEERTAYRTELYASLRRTYGRGP